MTAVTDAPTVRWRRLIVVLSISQTFTFVALMGAFPVVLSSMATDLGVSRAAVAMGSTLATLTGAVVALPVGRLLDRQGGRLPMTLGALIGMVGVGAWSQAETLPALYAAFPLIGAAQAMTMYEAAFAVIVGATDRAQRDRAFLTMTMAAGLATHLATPVVGWCEVEYGWRATILALAISLAVIVTPCNLWVIPSRQQHLQRVRLRTGLSLGEAICRGKFWLVAIAFTAQAGSGAAFLMLLVTYFRDIGHPSMVATSIPVTLGVVMIATRFVLATVARRVPMVRAATFAFAVQAGGMLSLPAVGLSIPLTLLCVVAVGIGTGVVVIARPSIVADTFGAMQFATVLAAMTVPAALSRAGVPLVAASFADWRFMVGTGLLALIACAALLPLALKPGPPTAR